MVGSDLEKLKGYAIELGSTTTLTASQVADAFKMIGSQQPQLLESGEALKQVTKYAITLSEAAGIELSTPHRRFRHQSTRWVAIQAMLQGL